MRKVRLLIVAALAIALTLAAPAASHAAPDGCDSPGGPRPAHPGGKPVNVWLAGDSTMAPPTTGTCPVGWGHEFDALFKSNVTVHNLAFGGRSIQTWLYETGVTSTIGDDGECELTAGTYSPRWQQVLDGIKAGDYLFIQFGINDGSRTCPRHVGTERYRELMTYMAQTALDRGAHPIVLSAVAAITCSGDTAVKNRGFTEPTIAAAEATGADYIDLQTLSVDYYNSLALCPNDSDYTSGLVGQIFCNDHTHFESYGAARIAELVAGALRDQRIRLARSLLPAASSNEEIA
ncbi:MAG TPA: carbohydrate esterase [Actinoplanes sp.]|nr:carbohydrate esterase [Actinoplanes sp.]